MKKIILSIFLIPTLILFSGTTGKISGLIKDSQTGEPLIGVNVMIEGSSQGAATDIDGYYAIINVMPGTYTLKISYIGYNTVMVTDVVVNIDLTTEINVDLVGDTIQLEQAVIVAERPIVKKDVSGSSANIDFAEIKSLPVSNVNSVIGLQAGIKAGQDGISIRGGGYDETSIVVDGMTMKDERTNTPIGTVGMTAVKQVQVLTGGFNAEYGNIRSGMVNVGTIEGDKRIYNVSFLGRLSPPSQKHFTGMPTSPNSYWIRPYVDPAVAYTGTDNGAWDEYTQAQYQEFRGWNKVSEESLKDDDPTNDLTPEAARQLFLWQHRKQVAITKPDYDFDVTVNGPFPVLSKQLGDLRFMANYRQQRTMYFIPLSDDAFRNWNFQLNMTSDLDVGMKLTLINIMGESTGTTSSRSGNAGIFSSSFGIASDLDTRAGASYLDTRVFATDYWSPTKIGFQAYGAKLTHVINSDTYYDLKLSAVHTRYDTNPGELRDTSRVYNFGGFLTDVSPFGYYSGQASGVGSSMNMGLGFSNSRDTSRVTAYTLKFDISSQLNKYNNVKTGIEVVYTDNNVNYALEEPSLPSRNSHSVWQTFPIRGAFYIQDKLEFESMIANIGVRVDYSWANSDWYEFDPYNSALSGANSAGIDTLLAKADAKHNIDVSPRLGIAFPITVDSKLFFNYGHYRSMPSPEQLFLLRRDQTSQRITRMADPNNPLPKTVAYELGYEHNLFNQFLLRVAGYYKDISSQPRLVRFTNRDNSVSYLTPQPNNYRDIRGFEITLRKSRGNWVRGFVNYTYEVVTAGNFGLGTYYENAALQREEERNVAAFQQSKPVPRPYARANIEFFTPAEYGPQYLGVNWLGRWSLSFLASWSAGPYFSWTGPGGTIPGHTNNIQWADFYNADLRLSKEVEVGPFAMELFMDIRNVFNIKYMSYRAGFADAKDFDAYMKSLHLPADYQKFGYDYEVGDDRPGEWNEDYIDQPNLGYSAFLNPRNVFFGLRFTVDLN